MANDFLTSQIIPGTPLPHHEHRQMKVVFVVFIAIILIVEATYYFTRSPSVAPPVQAPVAVDHQAVMRAAIISQLSNVETPTAAQVNQITQQLQKSKSTVTEAQRAAIIKQLQGSTN